MKRSPMKPGKPLERKAPMARSTSTLKASKPMARGASKMRATRMKVSRPKNAPTAAEARYMGEVAALGCALCRRLGYGATPAEVHHPRRGTGAGTRSSHYDTIPLCFEHHRGNTGIHGMGVKAWMAHYDISEAELTVETQILLAAHLPDV